MTQSALSATSFNLVLTLQCTDARGTVAAVSGALFEHGADLLETQHYTDRATGDFFLRVHFTIPASDERRSAMTARLTEVLAAQQGVFTYHCLDVPTRALILVGRQTHCLQDLLWRARSGDLDLDVVAVASNDTEARDLVLEGGTPYYHIEAAVDERAVSETAILELVDKHEIDLVILARYMRVLSPEFCESLAGRVINIHHSLLPSFVGAQPYRRAFERGVKVVGATAHFATAELDQGPIIEQGVARADRAESAGELASIGRDVECHVLTRAVRLYAQHRVLVHGSRTVIFSR